MLELSGKILFASDLHGRTLRAEFLLDAIEREKPDYIVYLGDYMYNGPRNGVPNDYEPMVLSNMINAYASKSFGVEGNCDSRIDHMLLKFPISLTLDALINGKTVTMYHGDDASTKAVSHGLKDVYIFGHTHVHRIDKTGMTTFINPGSIGFPKDKTKGSYAVWEGNTITIKELEDGNVLLEKTL
ncbi:MAG: phosphodiesterase [Bacilli bacterium]|nr:phosphodiesterase [Bacilli bacterium]